MNLFIKLKTGESLDKIFSRFLFPAGLCLGFALAGCTLLTTRPIQEMSITAAAIRAAKEVQADTLSPDFFRLAGEWYFQAKHEYKFKNFKMAKDYAEKARFFAEKAEYESIRNGGNRTDQGVTDPLANGGGGDAGGAPNEGGANGAGGGNGKGPPDPKSTPYAYPTPAGTPADVYDQRKAEDDARAQAQAKPNAAASTTPGSTNPSDVNYLPPLPTKAK
jgi:hypothetical protein